jgi:hypothetical protein
MSCWRQNVNAIWPLRSYARYAEDRLDGRQTPRADI